MTCACHDEQSYHEVTLNTFLLLRGSEVEGEASTSSNMTSLPHIQAPDLRIKTEPLTPRAFLPFGTVIQNPAHLHSIDRVHHNVVSANQGSALKYIDVTHMTDYYSLAPSGTPAKTVMNMFVCSPRKLHRMPSADSPHGRSAEADANLAFPVQILERHPFTPQTFIPTGLSSNDASTRYLVIVAPTLPETALYPLHAPRRTRSITDMFSWFGASSNTAHNISSTSPQSDSAPQAPKGPGRPDLTRLRAFIADGSQAVTYGPGTWHAPMVVLGSNSIDFVVVQHANAVALEDCQEIAIRKDDDAEGLHVIIDQTILDRVPRLGTSKL